MLDKSLIRTAKQSTSPSKQQTNAKAFVRIYIQMASQPEWSCTRRPCRRRTRIPSGARWRWPSSCFSETAGDVYGGGSDNRYLVLQVVHTNQYGFRKLGRMIREIVLIKLDFETTFGKLEHEVILQVIKHKGFSYISMDFMDQIHPNLWYLC